MSENMTSSNIENNDFNLDNEEMDYNNLITRLKEIKIAITLLEKNILK